MEEWKIVEIKDICTGIYEGPHATPKESLTGGIYLGIPAISSDGHINFDNAKRISEEDLPIWTKRVTPQEDDIVFTNEATLNLYAIIPAGFHGCLGRRLGLIRPNKNLVDVRYLFYFFFSPEWRETVSRNKVSGATVERILMTKFPHFPVKLPPLSVQKRIADILSSIDEKIAINNRINHNLEEQAQALYKSWFIDFEPFKDRKFVDSELGMIPDGWHVGTLSELATITMGQSPSGSSFNEEGNGIIFYQGRTEFGFRFPSIKLFTTEPTRFSTPGSILMSVRAPVGDINVSKKRCCIGRGLASIEPFMKSYSFVLYTIKGQSEQLDLYNGEGTVFGSINRKELEGLSVIIPPEDIINSFNELVTPLDTKIEELSDENENLQIERDTLLPQLMSGSLTC